MAPTHLQRVTAMDNAAEMLARTYYMRRIQALEHALEALEPDHALLKRG